MSFWRFIAPGADLGPQFSTTYDLFLVALSFLVASFAGANALEVVERMASARSAQSRLRWLATGAATMGSGIWAMHFIGMLAFHLPLAVSYDLTITLFSMVPAVFASAMALYFMVGAKISFWRLNLGGLLMAVGIGGMHYTGMEAMRMEAMMGYDPILFALSILVAHVLATLSLYIKFLPGAAARTWFRKASSATAMGSAVACMHYTAMAAAKFYPGSMGAPGVVFEQSWMAVTIALVTSGIIGLAIVAALVDRRMAGLTHSLIRSEELSRLILESAGEGIFGLDAHGLTTFVNPAAARMLGFDRVEVLEKPVQEIVQQVPNDGSSPAAGPSAIEATLRDGDARVVPHELFGRKGGASIPVAYTVTSIRNEGAVVGAVVTFSDITAAKQTERELLRAKQEAETASRMKSEFLARMSHEIRTPMTAVIGFTGLLLDGELSAEQRSFAETVRSSADALLSLINDILDFSKIEAGKLAIEPIPFDLEVTVSDALELFGARAHDKGLELVMRYAPEAPRWVIGDPGRIRQILTNLIGNALKFTEAGHVSVNVDTEERGEGKALFHFSVTDTGIGIPAEKQAGLFEIFMQADSSTTRRYGGSGLGLAISKQFVELMGGKIGLRSEPGKGSTFWLELTLPLSEKREVPASRPASLRGLRVLIVDDNAVNRHVVDEQIKQWSMRSTAVASGAEALRALREAYVAGDLFQFGLLDFNMPEMDGEVLARAIKSDRALAGTVLLLLTSAGQRGDAKRMTEAGFAGYLTKPIRASLLMDALATAWASLGKEVPLITRHLLAERRVSAAAEPLGESEAIQARVLVVEDNPVNQRLVRLMLERMGCRVDPAANGKEAVEMARNLPYDIVFMDCQMPEMDGYQATREIRSRETGARHLPIVALTAGAMEGDREKALQAGMDDYLTKPVQREDLHRALGRWLRSLPAATPPVAPPASDRAAPEDLDAFLETLQNLREGIGEEGVAATLPGFFRRTAETIALLRQAVTSNDVSEVRRLSHDLKGSCGTVGAKSMAKISVELEAEMELGSVADAIALVDSLQRLCVHLEDAFAKYRGTAPAARPRAARCP